MLKASFVVGSKLTLFVITVRVCPNAAFAAVSKTPPSDFLIVTIAPALPLSTAAAPKSRMTVRVSTEAWH
jgi:hypothetical protein